MTNRYRPLTNNAWAISCDEQFEPGAQVDVTLRSGAVKRETLGEFLYATGGAFVYGVAAKAKPPAAKIGDLSGVLALFDRAKLKLKYPAIVLSVPATQDVIRITVAGERARVPGSLTVTAAEYEDDAAGQDEQRRRPWYGRVLRDGTFESSGKLAQGDVTALDARLREFAADPAGVASEHGRLTGRCCFCNLPLSDERSTAVGYGRKCASNYGMPWGKGAAEPVLPKPAPAAQRSLMDLVLQMEAGQ